MIGSFGVAITAFLQVGFLNRKYVCYQWTGIAIAVAGVAVVSLQVVLSAQAGIGDGSVTQVAIAVVLRIVSMVLGKALAVMDEFIIHGHIAPPMFTMGCEGAWGILIGCGLLAVAQHLPRSLQEGQGLREETLETLQFLKHTPRLVQMLFALAVTEFAASAAWLQVVKLTRATVVGFIGCIEMIIVWAAQTVIFYVAKDPGHGEEWSKWSFIQLGGYVLIVVGTAVFGGAIKVPSWTYEDRQTPLRDQSVECDAPHML
jgi:hypothetical protein